MAVARWTLPLALSLGLLSRAAGFTCSGLARPPCSELRMGLESEEQDSLAAEFKRVLREGKAAEALTIGLREVADLPRSPTPDLAPQEVVRACLVALQHNDEPAEDAGYRVCYAFADSMVRAAAGPRGQITTVEDFVAFAKNPTFSSMAYSRTFDFTGDCNLIEGSTTRGAMATQMVKLETRDGRIREFLWTLQQQRRPPLQGCWMVHECLAKEKAIYLTL